MRLLRLFLAFSTGSAWAQTVAVPGAPQAPGAVPTVQVQVESPNALGSIGLQGNPLAGQPLTGWDPAAPKNSSSLLPAVVPAAEALPLIDVPTPDLAGAVEPTPSKAAPQGLPEDSHVPAGVLKAPAESSRDWADAQFDKLQGVRKGARPELRLEDASDGEAAVLASIGTKQAPPAARGTARPLASGIRPPDFEALARSVPPQEEKRVLPRFVPQPVAATVDALLGRLGWKAPPQVPLEEQGLRDSLALTYEHIRTGRLQNAIDALERDFADADARKWHRANRQYAGYSAQAMEYYRHVEQAVIAGHAAARARAGDETLIAEARRAEEAGTLLGHGYRPTATQKGETCVPNSLFNAISASVGFALPAMVERLVEDARSRLNFEVKQPNGERLEDAAALERKLPGLRVSLDAAGGLDVSSLKRYADLIGLPMTVRGPPSSEAELQSLMESGEVLLTWRFFHPRHRLQAGGDGVTGHDHEVLLHETHMLGAFFSRSRTRWLYMVQDSGAGSTDFFTWDELRNMVKEIQILTPSSPLHLP